MKKKQVIEKINQDIKKVIIPDHNQTILHNFLIQENKFEKHESLEISNSNKKKLPILKLCYSLMFVLLLVFIIPLFKTSTPPKSPVLISKPQQTYAIQAISLLNYANSLSDNTNPKMRLRLNNQNNIYNDIVNTVTDHLLMIEDMFYTKNFEYNYIVLENSEYQYKLEITIPITNEAYTLYFNEVIVSEKLSTINGIIDDGNNSYSLSGKKETKEDECEIELKLNLSQNSYLIVSQEIEHNENEYEYTYYVNNKKTEEFSISKETKNEETVIELEIKNTTSKQEFEFEYINNKIYVEYEYNNLEGEIIITNYDEYYEFYFSSDNIIAKYKNN